MKCCDSVVIPSGCTNQCDYLTDACCVINTDNLPCLYPPVTTTGTAIGGFKQITVVSTTGIEIGMSLFVDDEPTGQKVVGIVSTVIYFDKVNPAGFISTEIVFKFAEQKQCDINAAVDAKLCNLSGANGIVYTSVTGGDFPISSGLYPTWTYGPSDYTAQSYTTTTAGYYRLTVEIYVGFDADSSLDIGVSKNGAFPGIIDTFESGYIVNPVIGAIATSSSHTLTFLIEAASGDVLRLMYRARTGFSEIAPIKILIEKINFIS